MVIFILILLVFVITDEPLCLVVSNPIAVWFFSMFFKTNSDPILGCKNFFFLKFCKQSNIMRFYCGKEILAFQSLVSCLDFLFGIMFLLYLVFKI